MIHTHREKHKEKNHSRREGFNHSRREGFCCRLHHAQASPEGDAGVEAWGRSQKALTINNGHVQVTEEQGPEKHGVVSLAGLENRKGRGLSL